MSRPLIRVVVGENAGIIMFFSKQAFHVVAIGLIVVCQNQWSDLHAETQPKRLSNLVRNLRLANTRYIEDHYNVTEQPTRTKTEMRISQHNNIANLDIWKYNGHPRNLNHSMRKQYKKSKYGIELNTSNPCKHISNQKS